MQTLLAVLLSLVLSGAARAEEAAGAPAAPAPPVAPDSLAAALPEPAAELYPLERCPITGNLLGSMGDPIVMVVHGMTVQLCCAHCEQATRDREDEIRRAVVKALVKRDGPDYPLTTCLACGSALPKKPLNLVWGSTLLRVDSEACAAGLAEHGAKWALAVRRARAGAPATP
jgi:hypothetical protein